MKYEDDCKDLKCSDVVIKGRELSERIERLHNLIIEIRPVGNRLGDVVGRAGRNVPDDCGQERAEPNGFLGEIDALLDDLSEIKDSLMTGVALVEDIY